MLSLPLGWPALPLRWSPGCSPGCSFAGLRHNRSSARASGSIDRLFLDGNVHLLCRGGQHISVHAAGVVVGSAGVVLLA